jgi:hypothetical protein
MVITHPSLQLWEKGFKGSSPPEMCSKVHTPTLLHPAGDDDPTYYPGGSCVMALRENSLSSRSEPFPLMNHGFVVRGNIADASISRDVDACLKSTVDFFKKHFSETPKVSTTEVKHVILFFNLFISLSLSLSCVQSLFNDTINDKKYTYSYIQKK